MARARSALGDEARAVGLRTARGLRHRRNWLQLGKFCLVGGIGYVVNLVVYALLVTGADVDYRLAAICSFLVAVTNNYTWNRLWTFRGQRGHVGWQGLRFLVVAVIAYVANILLLTGLIALGLDKVVSQAIAVILVTPLNFLGNKLWSFRSRR